MQIFSSPADMQAWSAARRSEGATLGFVPTMGALHDGHLTLVADAARRCDSTVVSIFVNPLQFNQSADFDSYPRPIDDDVAACERAGVNVVFAPTAADMYPAGFQTRVLPGPLADLMEGPGRPGHFEGVLTVVAKLFGAVQPDVAIFGQKDYQQLRIITQMAADLDLPVEVVGHPIVRDSDGVAKSSRNVRLTAAQRAAAVVVPRSLQLAVQAAVDGQPVAEVERVAIELVTGEPAAQHEYTTVFDASTLESLDPSAPIPPELRERGNVRVATAVWFDDVRLIDNRDLFDPVDHLDQ